ncbi:MAG: hypothetical protein MJ252_26945, partial [archaeon]|nr:hypothetical protein [archaeon]
EEKKKENNYNRSRNERCYDYRANLEKCEFYLYKSNGKKKEIFNTTSDSNKSILFRSNTNNSLGSNYRFSYIQSIQNNQFLKHSENEKYDPFDSTNLHNKIHKSSFFDSLKNFDSTFIQ